MKTWSYKAITRQAEKKIISLMAQSETATDPEYAKLYEQWAYGVYLGWNNLTMGWMNDGDDELLESLTKRKQLTTQNSNQEAPGACSAAAEIKEI